MAVYDVVRMALTLLLRDRPTIGRPTAGRAARGVGKHLKELAHCQVVSWDLHRLLVPAVARLSPQKIWAAHHKDRHILDIAAVAARVSVARAAASCIAAADVAEMAGCAVQVGLV